VKMRWRYLVSVFVIVCFIIGLMYLLLYPPSLDESPFGRIVKNTNIFVPSLAALLAAVIALSAADPKKKKVKAHVDNPYITKCIENWEITYPTEELNEKLEEWFENCRKPITSHKVQFRITNTSDFDWVKPVVTFWLPIGKQHPQKKNESNQHYSTLSYNSNTYNAPADVRTLQMVDGVIISNSHLPYWKQERSLTIWIKMVLDNHGLEPFSVEVSVDCEDAGGFAQEVVIYPRDLLESIGENCISEETHGGMRSQEERNQGTNQETD